MHCVLALLVIVQQYAGQPIHGTIMLCEQPLDLSFLVVHLPYIHAENDLLHFFIAKNLEQLVSEEFEWSDKTACCILIIPN